MVPFSHCIRAIGLDNDTLVRCEDERIDIRRYRSKGSVKRTFPIITAVSDTSHINQQRAIVSSFMGPPLLDWTRPRLLKASTAHHHTTLSPLGQPLQVTSDHYDAAAVLLLHVCSPYRDVLVLARRCSPPNAGRLGSPMDVDETRSGSVCIQ